MKICCIYILSHLDPNINTSETAANSNAKIKTSVIPLGISYIATTIKQSGHDVSMVPFIEGMSYENFIQNIEVNIDLFCISVTSYDCWLLTQKLLPKLKFNYPSTKIIAGGIYVTLSPKEVIQDKNIDAVCIGDGEKAIINYIDALKNNELNKKIDNLFIKQQDSSVLECDNSYFIDDLDSLPLIDRHMWDKWTFDTTQHKVLVERGCPYRCVYCANNKLGQVSKGKYLRYRSINSIIEEFEYIIREYPQTNSFMLYAENIASDTIQFLKLCKALKEFNEKSVNKINYTIILNVTKYFIKNREVFDAIKSANIKWVMFGFETASKEIRKKLNRPEYDNKDILKFCRQMQKRNIHITIYAMYCYPYETRKSYNETVKWLRFFKPDSIGWFWMEPQKNTELYNRFFVRKDENYKTTYLKKIIANWHFIIFKFKVYITYKPFIETLFLSTEQFGIGEYLFFIWRKHNTSKRKKLEEYKNEAKKQFDLKNFAKAIKYLNKIEILGDSWIYADRAFANFKLGKKEEALKDINKAIELEKDNKNYHNLRDKIVN